jgi:hypothetical protein
MANPVKGEVEFVVGDKTYTLKLGHNGRAEAEAVLGKTWGEIGDEFRNPETITHGTVRGILWAALRQFHSKLSLFDVGDMMDEVGDEYVGTKIGEAMLAAAPKGAADRPQ